MDNKDLGKTASKREDVLKGTTLRVYRYMYKEGRPVGLHEVQKALSLSSASVAQYHVNKLIEAGLVQKESTGRYHVDRLVFENMIRIRRALVPFQTTYAIFFISSFVVLLTVLRPSIISSVYYFAVAINLAAIIIFVTQAYRTLRNRDSI